MSDDVYDFFFSYPRAELKNSYLAKFFDDLHDEVKRVRGVTVDRAFRDQDGKRGADWEQALNQGLQNSRTLVAVFCPAYFNSSDCLNEIRVFVDRQNAFLNGDPAREKLPRAIKPVVWVPFGDDDIPRDLSSLQYDKKDDEFFKARGLGPYLRASRRTSRYWTFVQDLARDIVDTAKQVQLPPIAHFPSFHSDDAPIAVSRRRDGSGPDHVRFVYLAPTEDLPLVEGRKDFYGPESRAWKPFRPEVHRNVGALAEQIADECRFTWDELPFDAALPRNVRTAEDHRTVVVILMDGWVVKMPDYAEVMATLDEMNVPNCGVLVSWASDARTSQERHHLSDRIRRALWRFTNDANSARFKAVDSYADFRARLGDALTRLQNAVLMAPERDGRALGGPPKPDISSMG